jgi:hydrogenase/urease accessory protein HupE
MAASSVCMVLLIRGYRRSRSRLLLWCALCFVGLALNNLLLVIDLLLLPDTDLSLLRTVVHLGALGVLIYGFIWEAEP